jgi:Ca2+-binding RTX toxin-like protein
LQAVGGGQGNDIFRFIENLTGSAHDDRLTGNSEVNTLVGGAGKDQLDGKAGADTMSGGIGDDTYVVDNTGDKVIEKSGEGSDLVKSSVSFTLGSYVENLTLTGGGTINATGNSGANVLTGNSAANILDGKAGADTMSGGKGDDTYVVDNTGDKVIEKSGEGTDLVKSSVSFTLGSYVENLTLTGSGTINATGNSGANVLTGSSAANILDGKAGADMMSGGRGDDTYVVDNTGDKVIEKSGEGTDLVKSSVSFTLGSYVENLTLTGSGTINATGNSGANLLTGNSAANILDGKAGADTMSGGKGDDTYVVDNAGDKVIEKSGEGTDLVKSSISFTLGSYIENLTLTGSGTINATGNAGANVLTGNSSANILDGKAGADTMSGGKGDDTYVVDNTGDKVVEKSGQGTDLVKSSVSFTLGSYVENLTLTGSGKIKASGNSGVNVLTGNGGDNIVDGKGGADRLIGGLGADDLYGGTGADTFAFLALTDSTVGSTGRDTIFDFSRKDGDRIDVSAIDASSKAMGNQAFKFVGTASFKKVAGELRYELKNGDAYIHADVDGDGKSDFSIHVDAVTSLKSTDFVL